MEFGDGNIILHYIETTITQVYIGFMIKPQHRGANLD